MSRLPYLDALRGYAILFVIIGHCVFTIGDLPPTITTSLLAYGGRGVQLFFVVSAITLLYSWNAKHDGCLPFYLRRMFRIAPMWWLAMAYWLLRMGMEPRYFAPNGVDVHDIVLSATLLNGISPKALMPIVPGGWSIAAEVLFYVVFPLLTLLCTNLTRSIFALVISVLLQHLGSNLVLSIDIASEVTRAAFLEHSIINQLPIFILGVCTFHAISIANCPRGVASTTVIIAGAALAALPYAAPMVQPTPMAFGICWAFIAWGLANGGAAILTNRPIEFLGQISYSAYFWHFIFLDNPIDAPRLSGGSVALFALFLKTLAFTIPLSFLTFRLIEQPFMRLGSQIAKQPRYSYRLTD